MGKRVNWTIELCKASARQFSQKSVWEACDQNAYMAAYRKGWLKECCSHMDESAPKVSYSECALASYLYKTSGQWSKGDPRTYKAALRHGWFEACLTQDDNFISENTVKINQNPHSKRSRLRWTLEACKASAERYVCRNHWQLNESGAYQAANRNGWLDLCSHQPVRNLEQWTLDACIESAKGYSTIHEWRRFVPEAYNAALKQSFIQKIMAVIYANGFDALPKNKKKIASDEEDDWLCLY